MQTFLSHARPLACALAATAALAAPSRADDYAPLVYEGRISPCDAIPGIMLTRYNTMTGGDRRTRYVLSETCYSPDARWFAGPETLVGFEPVYGEAGLLGRFEMLEDGAQSHQRRWFSASNVEGLTGEEEIPANPEVFETMVRTTAETTTQFQTGAATEAMGTGFSYLKPRPEVTTLPDGLWIVDGSAANWHRLDDGQAPVRTGSMFAGTFNLLMQVQGGAMRLVATSPVSTNESLALQIGGGTVDGQLRYTVTNPKTAAALEPREATEAEAQVDRMLGRVIEDRGQLRVVAVGVGRYVLRRDGAEAVEDVSIKLVMRPVPDFVTPDMVREVFPDFGSL